MKFIHCADLHIDSPFTGLSNIDPDLKAILFKSTFDSFFRIVELAIEEDVDCVLIAGDIYDGADKSLQAQLKFKKGLQQLSDEGIPAFIVHGNHDSLDGWSATLEWPDNVHIFSGEEVEKVPLKKGRRILANIYGISYKTRDIKDNLSLQFKKKGRKLAIGLLHSNVGTSTGHESYAPATKSELSSSKMDYWALGHVHNHQILSKKNPAIVYPGNSQARNPREIGSKGCCLVELQENGDCDIQFIPTDVVRYGHGTVNITDLETIDEVIKAIKDQCETISQASEERHAIIRLSLTGNSELYTELNRDGAIDDIIEDVRSHYSGQNPIIWLEKIKSNVRSVIDIDSLRGGKDLIGDIISMYDSLDDDKSETWEVIQERLKPLFETWKGSKYLDQLDQEELLEIAQESMNHTIEKLVGDE